MRCRFRVDTTPVKRLISQSIAALALAGCAAAGRGPDAPVPASEPRESVRLSVDLARDQRCEEAFDLALYENRAVELVAWDGSSGCRGRTVTIRYLAREASRDDIVRAAAALAEKVVADTPHTPEPHGEPR
jgi:hypothetical protein